MTYFFMMVNEEIDYRPAAEKQHTGKQEFGNGGTLHSCWSAFKMRPRREDGRSPERKTALFKYLQCR